MWTTKKAAITLMLIAPLARNPAHAQGVAPSAAPSDRSSPLTLETGSGRVVTLQGAAANVFVADPKVAEVRPASPGTLFVFGVGPGQTTIAAIDAAGRTLLDTQIIVQPSNYAAAQAQAAASRAAPGRHISVQAAPRGVTVTGEVSTPAEAAQIISTVRTHLADGQLLDDRIGVQSSVQVTLRVRIAEMSRSLTRNLGINWQAIGRTGKFAAGFATGTAIANALTAANPSVVNVGTPDVNALIDALAQDNLVRILAEPNLTAMSGQSASFLSGGEYPIPVAQQNNQVTIEFKQYGVKLTFVPTVLTSGRINLHVSPEVSELSTQGAVQLSAGNSSIQIPALTIRRAETTVELGSGQSFAIAGLLQTSVTQQTSSVPVLGDIPVLGALFRSNGFAREETELVVVVTPYVAQPVSDPNALTLPGQDTVPARERDRILGLQQVARAPYTRPIPVSGQAGFIVQ